MISINGDFIVCSKFEEQKDVVENSGILLYNKIEEGFQKINKFKIEELHLSEKTDFPFSVGDIVVSASSGTKLKNDNKEIWLFHPEHILAKIER